MSVLDSDIMVAALRGDKNAEEEIISIKPEERFTTVISVIEIFQGALLHTKKEEKLLHVVNLFSHLNIYDLDFSSSIIASDIFARNRLSGNIIDTFDVLIGSICLSKGEKVITRNIADFSRIPGLKVEKW